MNRVLIVAAAVWAVSGVIAPPAGGAVSCDGEPATIVGTHGDDVIYGTPGDDVIAALSGADIVYGLGGADTICGGSGADTIKGGPGQDHLIGGGNSDYLSGGPGRDKLVGGNGDDQLFGGKGKDRLEGGAGADELRGGSDDDWITGGAGPDMIDGNAGIDTASWRSAPQGVHVHLPTRTATGDGSDAVHHIENLHGSEFDDTLTGHARANVIRGFGGADTISGKSGDDVVAGGPGNDTIWGGSGSDNIAGNGGSDDLRGGDGDDTVIGGIGADELRGGSGADTVFGGTGRDVLYGNDGADDLKGGDGDDDLRGGPGTDGCDGGAGSETAATCEVLADPYTMGLVLREGWGAQNAKPGLIDHEIDKITIHHAGTATGTVGVAQFRGWQAYHFSLGWPDLAYHFIVGRDGAVYEARPWTAAGDTATSYDPDGHLLLVVEGNFEEDVPTAGQLESLAIMVAWGAEQFDVPVDEITGHRDHAATTCPGGNLYDHIVSGSIARQAQDIIDAGGVTLIVE